MVEQTDLMKRFEKVTAEMKQAEQKGSDRNIFYFKPADGRVGDVVVVEKVNIEAAKVVINGAGQSVEIPEKPVIVGLHQRLNKKFKITLSKTNERRLFELFAADWVGKKIMITGIPSKVINGSQVTWVDWAGLP